MKTMSRKATALLTALVLTIFMTNIAAAKSAPTAKDEKKLKTEISMLDKDATLPHGDQVVLDRLSKEYNVTADQITALHDKKLGYGEIAAIYAFADKLPGGITDDNVNKVVTMHQSSPGWMKMAKSLDVDLGSIAKKVDGIEKDAHKDIKKASTETKGSAGGGTGGDRSYGGTKY